MSVVSVQPNDRVTFGVDFEDEHLLVVSKRAGLVTQPGLGHEHDTLLNGLHARYGDRLRHLGKARDFGLLHRLDRETSGLLIVGLSREAYDAMRKAFERREVAKFYWAVCLRAPKKAIGLIDKPLSESTPRTNEKKLSRILPGGKSSQTAYRLVQASEEAALVEARPLTGRLHQVRVHLESIGCPILGDDFYASDHVERMSPRLALHAHRLVFTHPINGQRLDVRTLFPKDLRPLLRRLHLDLPGPDGTTHAKTTATAEAEPGVDDFKADQARS
jgi:RluA family pseudouridine synthase